LSFWFQDPDLLAPGESLTVEYWLNGGADMGSQVATPVPHYAANAGLVATGQGQRYDFQARKFFYSVTFTNRGTETANFQTRGGGLT
jgi:hypothetical protein